MTINNDEMSSQDIKGLLYSYFPDTKLEDEEAITQQIDDGEILFKPERILSYLQTVFLPTSAFCDQC